MRHATIKLEKHFGSPTPLWTLRGTGDYRIDGLQFGWKLEAVKPGMQEFNARRAALGLEPIAFTIR